MAILNAELGGSGDPMAPHTMVLLQEVRPVLRKINPDAYYWSCKRTSPWAMGSRR